MILSALKRSFFSIHFYIVAGLIALMLFPLTWPISLPNEFWVKQVLIHVLWGGLFYLNLLVLAPKLLYKNKVLSFLVILIAILVLVVYLNHWLDDLTGSKRAVMRTFNKKESDNHGFDNLWTLLSALVMLGISSIVAISRKIELDQIAFQATERDRVNTELSLLKAQINPHFFFNILHTIYALADTNPAASKDAIYTLSHMMRYVIYETKNDLTDLEKEFKFIEDYINLMRLRLTENVQIIYEKQEGMQNYEIAPMLFLPFIENAFKHGVSSVHPSYIYIDISQSANQLKLEVKNSLFEEKSRYLEESNGIGVMNTRRRLDLLYPGKYTLEVYREPGINDYTVILTLLLK
ncbi:sensor histidine kinase [Pedobacter sp. HMF7647]|uniref:Sensor histidine kinase n=1 Tax=Hufsiella arboris TaxID=2695275 RepID=A0A7K1YEW3_9SPHI|nr:histidine kinase [Hufsiella arboris]MXV53146.1 sensor histidine kinase [Hufsiella arboris]